MQILIKKVLTNYKKFAIMYIESESEEIKMKLVIDIPEEDYKNGTLPNYFKCYSTKLDKIICNGTPLPKGYGRLINADDVYDALGPYVSFSDLYDALNEIPTIVEADKEE